MFPTSILRKTETKVISVGQPITNSGGMVLLITGVPLFYVSAHHFTPQDFNNAKHTYDLKNQSGLYGEDETFFKR
jgi:hypothetical protein